MKHFKNIWSFLALAALFVIAEPQCRADQWNKKTVITIDEPVQLPKVVLQPGTYVFKLLYSSADRHIVQIFDKDDKHLITTILAIPNRRLQPTGKTVFTFWEAPAGQPAPVRAWFYPGDNFGQEFAYPKHMSKQIAANSKSSVVTSSAESTEEMKTAAISNTNEAGETVDLEKRISDTVTTAEPTAPPPPVAETRPAEPVRETTAAATPAPAPEPQTSPAPEPQPSPVPAELPRTASQLPLVGLLGMIALAGALLTRSQRRVQ